MAGLNRNSIVGKVFTYSRTLKSGDVASSVLGPLVLWPYMARGKITDLVVNQVATGANGTSGTITVKKNGTTICSTDAVMAVGDATGPMNAGGDFAALGAGSTVPVLKTDGTQTLQLGDVLTVDIAVGGTYSSTFPTWTVAVTVDPLDQPF